MLLFLTRHLISLPDQLAGRYCHEGIFQYLASPYCVSGRVESETQAGLVPRAALTVTLWWTAHSSSWAQGAGGGSLFSQKRHRIKSGLDVETLPHWLQSHPGSLTTGLSHTAQQQKLG